MLKGNRYLHFVYSYRTNRNISDSITVFNVKNQNMNIDGNSHLPISRLCIQGEALTIKRQWKREMKPIKQQVNVWLLIDALAFIIMSDEFIMEAFCKHALMNSGKQLPLMRLRFSSTDDMDVSSKCMNWTELSIYYLCLVVKKTWCKMITFISMGLKKWSIFGLFLATGNITNIDFREKSKYFFQFFSGVLFFFFKLVFKVEHLTLLWMVVWCVCVQYH